jgi:hypothetical protein
MTTFRRVVGEVSAPRHHRHRTTSTRSRDHHDHDNWGDHDDDRRHDCDD